MATKKYQDLQGYSVEDLKEGLTEREASFQSLTFDHAVRGLDNPLQLRGLRRDIARFQTEIRRRELEACSAEELASRSKIRARRKRNK